MDFHDDFSENEQEENEGDEIIGSDELLSQDELRLPESASILVRLHAVRAWLTRRQQDTRIEMGNTALALQEASQDQAFTPTRRRDSQQQEARLRQAQQRYQAAQERLETYEEAQTLLEECIDHTSGERVLVEYYLQLEDLMQKKQDDSRTSNASLASLADVLHRIEHVGAPSEED
ncbi:MAG TPA: hypothetical protein VFN23_06420 [Ktedonobacteraceae bacterium]|nr:hypothetical protein [Ktedonobacteraceae bacterium]